MKDSPEPAAIPLYFDFSNRLKQDCKSVVEIFPKCVAQKEISRMSLIFF